MGEGQTRLFRMTLLVAAGLPYTILSICDLVLRNMTRPTLDSWL